MGAYLSHSESLRVVSSHYPRRFASTPGPVLGPLQWLLPILCSGSDSPPRPARAPGLSETNTCRYAGPDISPPRARHLPSCSHQPHTSTALGRAYSLQGERKTWMLLPNPSPSSISPVDSCLSSSPLASVHLSGPPPPAPPRHSAFFPHASFQPRSLRPKTSEHYHPSLYILCHPYISSD